MTDRTLTRISGVAALAGGVLRIANTFIGRWLDARVMGAIYFAEDLLLLAGLLGIYLSRRRTLGLAGLIGFGLGVVGLFTIRSASLFGAAGYQLGAGELLVGLTVLGIPLFIAGDRAAPVAWMVSLALGLLSLIPSLTAPCALLAAITFGAGFALAGISLLQESR